MAAGQGKSANQQIIILAPSGGDGSDQHKQYLMTSGGQLVQQLVMQQQAQPSMQPNLIKSENPSVQPPVLKPAQNTEKSPVSQGVKIAPSGVKSDSSENYQLIFVQETITADQHNFVTKILAPNMPNIDGQVVVSSSSHGNQTGVIGNQEMQQQHITIATNPNQMATCVVPQEQITEGKQYQVVMETDQPTGVYESGDIVSLSMAASNVGQGGEPEQLIEGQIVGSEAAVVSNVQWS